MPKKSQNATGGVSKDDIRVCTLSEMRMMSIKVPPQMANSPDESTLVFPRALAERVFSQILTEWELPAENRERFKEAAGALEIMRTLQIQYFLFVIFRGGSPLEWLHSPNLHFGEKTPAQVILEGDIDAVFGYLDAVVFDDFSPYINPFHSLMGGDDA